MWDGKEVSETHHEESRSGRNGSAVVVDILGAHARQTDGNDGPESQNLLDQGGDVRDLLLKQAALPGVAVGIHGHDLVVGFLLNALAVFGGEVGDAHDEVSGDGVQTGGHHGQTDRFDLGWGNQLALRTGE